VHSGTGFAGADNTAVQPDVPPAFETSDITLLPGGARPPVTFTVKLAKSEAQRRYGLMFTSDLPDRHGMLFIFETDAVASILDEKYANPARYVVF
jgi:hypothetical protein